MARLAGAYADGTSDAVGASVRHPATAFGLLFFSLILPATAAGAETRPDEPPPDRGVKFSGLPTASYGTDELWGFGARLKLTDFGDGTQPPFLYSVEANWVKQLVSAWSAEEAAFVPSLLERREITYFD